MTFQERLEAIEERSEASLNRVEKALTSLQVHPITEFLAKIFYPVGTNNLTFGFFADNQSVFPPLHNSLFTGLNVSQSQEEKDSKTKTFQENQKIKIVIPLFAYVYFVHTYKQMKTEKKDLKVQFSNSNETLLR